MAGRKKSGILTAERQTRERKSYWRKKFLAVRERIAGLSTCAEKNARIWHKLRKLDEYKQAGVVMFYVSYSSEVDTHKMISQAMIEGKKVYVPKVLSQKNGGNKHELGVYLLKNGLKELSKSKWGILEPVFCRAGYDNIYFNLVIVPGVVYDEKFNRIGYGGGYYDKFLSSAKYGMSVGLAYECQVVKKLPIDKNDRKVQVLITEKKVRR